MVRAISTTGTGAGRGAMSRSRTMYGELDSPVLRASSLVVIGGDEVRFSTADDGDPVGGDAICRKERLRRRRAIPRRRDVASRGADAVSTPLNQDRRARVGIEV